MSEDFGGFDCVSINECSGKGHFHLPLAGFLDDAQGPLFTLELSADLIDPNLNLFGHGRWSLYWGGLGASTTYLRLYGVPFTNGQSVSCDLDLNGFTRGDNYLIDASRFLNAVVDNVNNDVTEMTETNENFIHITLKNGAIHVYELAPKKDGHWGNVLLSKVIAPSGKFVEFTWDDKCSAARLTRISDSLGDLLTVQWQDSKLSGLQVFPGTDEAMTLVATNAEDTIELLLSGDGIEADRLTYRLSIGAGNLSKLEMERAYGNEKACVFTDTASFTYKNEKIASYQLHLHDDADGDNFVATYAYTKNTDNNTSRTTVTCTQGTLTDKNGNGFKRQTGLYTYNFERDWLKSSTFNANGNIVHTTHDISFVAADQRTQLTSTRTINNGEAETAVWHFDCYGNLVKRDEAGVVTEWTYYNDYDVFNVSEESERVYTITKENWPGQWLQATLDHANPVGWGCLIFGNSGLTWYKVAHTTVTLTHAGTDYAKSAFQLPVDLDYPGSSAGFSSHPESEIVYFRHGDTLHPRSLTFYGYTKLTPIAHPHVNRTHTLVPFKKLTIIDPNFERVDISSLQLDIAKQWAKPFADSLKLQVNAAEDAEEKSTFTNMISNLDKCLEMQSKQNGVGFRLKKPWAAHSMHVESLSYETNQSNQASAGS
ncbi:hypothetical protein [Pseudomonas sp. 210_17 TE3656]